MKDAQWEMCSLEDEALLEKTVAVFTEIHARHFKNDRDANHALPIVTRSFRHDGAWRVFLLLTPWLLGRLFFPKENPQLTLPAGWDAASRAETAEFLALGPPVQVKLHGDDQKGNIQYQPGLGHFLIQPLAMAMNTFNSADAAFAAWSDVIQRRDQMMKEKHKECSWQKELSRREMFAGVFSGKSNRPT